MKATVVGVGARRSGTAKKTGKPYDGQTVYILTTSSDVVGKVADKLYFNFLSSMDYPDVKVGDELFYEYNQQGFMVDIGVTKKA